MNEQVEAYTDGACRGNPGPGGWGVLLRYAEHEKRLHGGEPDTTNNRMELLAAIMALETLSRPCQVALYTDSQYVQKGITEWLPGWIRRGLSRSRSGCRPWSRVPKRCSSDRSPPRRHPGPRPWSA